MQNILLKLLYMYLGYVYYVQDSILILGCLKDISVRGMAAGAAGSRKMIISASRYGWRRFKDDLHFYVMLGALPLGSIIFYANYIIGI